MPEDIDDEFARLLVSKRPERPIKPRLREILAQGPELKNLRTPSQLSPGDFDFRPATSPVGARVYVMRDTPDEILLVWSVFRHRGNFSVRPRHSRIGPSHPGLLAELFYAANAREDFEHVISSSQPAFDYVMSLESAIRTTDLDDLQALAMATRAKNAAIEALKECLT